MAQLIVSVGEDDNHNLVVDNPPVIDKQGRLIIAGTAGQVVYNQWRFFVFNNEQPVQKEEVAE